MSDQKPSEKAVTSVSQFVFPYDSAGEYGLDTVVFFNRSMFLEDQTPEGVEKAAREIQTDVALAFDAYAAEVVKADRARIVAALKDKIDIAEQAIKLKILEPRWSAEFVRGMIEAYTDAIEISNNITNNEKQNTI